MSLSDYQQLDSLADALLTVIRRKPQTLHDKQKLAARLKCTVGDIEASAGHLAACDYHIRMSRSGLTFVNAPDNLTGTEIAFGLKSKRFGKTIHAYRSVKSTNDIALALAEDGAPEGTIVTAEEQTRGRGRLGRTWYSPPGLNIYLSIILRPKLLPERAPALSIVAAVALAESVLRVVPADVRIKWPNDLMIGHRKTAGILTELSAERGKINHVVAGIGINVNQGAGTFPDEIRDSATSLRRALKRKVSRLELVRDLLLRFEKEYDLYCRSGLRRQLSRIRKHSYLIGKTITVKSGRTRFIGKAIDIDSAGQLVIETDTGRIPLAAGEVTLVKE